MTWKLPPNPCTWAKGAIHWGSLVLQSLLGKFKENKITEQMQKRHKISICGLAGTEQKSKKGNLPQIICRYTNLKKSFLLKNPPQNITEHSCKVFCVHAAAPLIFPPSHWRLTQKQCLHCNCLTLLSNFTLASWWKLSPGRALQLAFQKHLHMIWERYWEKQKYLVVFKKLYN